MALALVCITGDAQLTSEGHKTPAYIDFELGEWCVSEGDAEVSVVVHRTGEFRESFTLNWETVEETATAGKDFKGSGGTLVFQPMESFKTIQVGILHDDIEEGSESFWIKLSSDEPKAYFVRQAALVKIEEGASSGPLLLKARTGEAGTIVLSWSKGAECVLERASTLDSGNWETVECEMVDTGGEYEVHEPASGPVYIYRLRQK